MSTCNGCATPEATSLSRAVLHETTEKLPHRELVGSLQYLVNASRPDIAHVTRHVAKYLVCFDQTHYVQAKKVLRYLQATKNYGLVMDVSEGTPTELMTYSDADYANDPADRRSIRGYVTMLDGNVISYASRKQEINDMSTCEAEYVAMSEAAKDILWLQGLCKDLAWQHPVPLLRGDNEGAIALSTKPGKHSKTKHIDNKYHMVRRNVELDSMAVEHCGTEEMVTDIMTKPLGAVKFARFRKAMKVLPMVPAEKHHATSETTIHDTTTVS
ncbi:polyprotein [Phytophthora megakarya]|uniref:Polyprotein n=1 Tax=Phytophthora megakarya TaxID=4795 RepID=A0A225WDC1_9STRA|nr:polyprotein [Phytophthora megakarya]